MSQPRELISLELACDRSAPARAREALARSDQLGACREDAILTASELVSDVVLRSESQTDPTLHVRVALSAERLLISVHGPDVYGRFTNHAGAETSPSDGLGLQILDKLAERWGSEQVDGYRIWAELAASA